MNHKLLQIFLNESPSISDDALFLGVKSEFNVERLEYRYSEAKSSYKLVKTLIDKNLKYELYYHKNIGAFRVFCLHDDELVGYLSSKYQSEFKTHKILKKFPQVIIASSYIQNRNIGTTMYNIMIDYCGGLISDNSLTPASFGLWKKLSRLYNVYHFEFLNDDITSIEKVDAIDIASQIDYGNSFTMFVVSKDPIKEFEQLSNTKS